MIKASQFILMFWLCLFTQLTMANTKATVFWFDELDAGVDPVQVRYLVTTKYLRIDNGGLQDDFILFDAEMKIIYSVNHADKTILVIKNNNWLKPKYDFSIDVKQAPLEGAPIISGKQVQGYKVIVDGEVCTNIQFIPGMYKNEMNILKKYQMTLSSQQIRNLGNTPEHMKTPCFMLDVAYNEGGYYDLGMPVHEWHNRGYARYLKEYKSQNIPESFFQLPKDYKKYSVGVSQ
ncbi:MAG: hypothetical protein OQK76_10655 [Gammaproteobacteria bacterium]|nr:hypothetical protein [Gammaproteobacteria bacterium]MCW8911063.1 hypothetical protein [Gammaproteobacteria bacterium]MCW9004746.1 hypothetical protein [Gammaproteobacteria bacterium]MCW9056125.1 hypothetical protein [Gammaproteobacteria bacterium]